MISFLGKIALQFIAHELEKEGPEIQEYIVKEVGVLVDYFNEWLSAHYDKTQGINHG